jgi:hypothetical protein
MIDQFIEQWVSSITGILQQTAQVVYAVLLRCYCCYDFICCINDMCIMWLHLLCLHEVLVEVTALQQQDKAAVARIQRSCSPKAP